MNDCDFDKDSGGVENTGYTSNGSIILGAASFTSTAGFAQTGALVAARTLSGQVMLSLMDASTNLWSSCGILHSSDAGYCSSGTKALSATLDRVRVTTANGTDAFDAGSINILFQ